MSLAYQQCWPAGGTDSHTDVAGGLEIDTQLTAIEIASFRRLLIAELPAFYDEVDLTFPDMILESARNGADPCGYFTHAKRVYVGRMAGSAQVFTVATFKRGGSVKMGPTVTVPEARRYGVATAFRRQVEGSICAEPSVRKLYLTISASNVRTLLFNLGLGYQVEGALRGQYREGSMELVLGRIVRAGTGASPVPLRLADGEEGPIVIGAGPVDAGELASFLLPRMASSFGDIDEAFAAAIVASLAPERQRYERKGKLLLVARRHGAICGVAVLVPKRGGSTKISPLVADDVASLRVLIDAASSVSATRSRRRIYAVVPRHHHDAIRLLEERGFSLEARLREAYRRDVDAAVLGRETL